GLATVTSASSDRPSSDIPRRALSRRSAPSSAGAGSGARGRRSTASSSAGVSRPPKRSRIASVGRSGSRSSPRTTSRPRPTRPRKRCASSRSPVPARSRSRCRSRSRSAAYSRPSCFRISRSSARTRRAAAATSSRNNTSASGSVAITGTEAVSNDVQAFKDPPDLNASIVLVAMGSLFATLFVDISYLATTIGITPDASETETVLSLLARSLVGTSPYFYLVQATTAIILTLAANTAFAGFPRLASIMATDRFMPRQFAQRGDRLAFSTGIIALALLSSLLLIKFEASVTNLIPLYTVGVFIAFTLSQAGMVRKWLRERTRGWLASAGINAIGAGATAVDGVVVMFVKFSEGAWLVALVLPLLVLMLYGINAHYRSVGDRLLIDTATPVRLRPTVRRVIVPISRINCAPLLALAIARGRGGD